MVAQWQTQGTLAELLFQKGDVLVHLAELLFEVFIGNDAGLPGFQCAGVLHGIGDVKVEQVDRLHRVARGQLYLDNIRIRVGIHFERLIQNLRRHGRDGLAADALEQFRRADQGRKGVVRAVRIRRGGARPPGVLRHMGRAAFTPWRWLRIEESISFDPQGLSTISAPVGGPGLAYEGSMRPARSISTPLRFCMASGARRSRMRSQFGRVDGSQRLDLSRARRAVLSRLALPARDDDMDRQCDADRIAVHAGLRGLLSAGVPVRARELPDSDAPQGHGYGIS